MLKYFHSFALNSILELGETIQEEASKEILSMNMRSEFFKMLGSLILLLGAFSLCAWAFKRLVKAKGSRTYPTSAIKILDRRALSPKTTIYLIEVVNKTLVIGESNDKLSVLSEFPPNTNIKELMTTMLSPTPNSHKSPKEFVLNAIKRSKQNSK